MRDRRTYGPQPAENSRTTSERRLAQSRAGSPVSALQLQRSVGNRATTALLGAARTTKPSGGRVRLQRNEKSAALLKTLATPKPKPGPVVEVQKQLVNKLDVEFAADFPGGLLNLGGILIDAMPEKDEDLVKQAQLIGFPVSGGFQSAGGVSKGKMITERGFDRLVVENTLKTMIDAKEIEYLRLAGLPNEEWKILIEIHYFRERDMSATGFHKDTLGETLFVNLNYAMDKQVIGPEIVVNPPASPTHDEQLLNTLPPEFRKDLAVTRAELKAPTEIEVGMVDPYAYVAFVDEAVHHATPFYGHRYVTPPDLARYLEKTYPAEFKEASHAYAWKQDVSSLSGKWRAWMQIIGPSLTADLLRQELEPMSPQFDEARSAYTKYSKRPWKHYWSWYSEYVDPNIISPEDSSKWLGWMNVIAAGEANNARHFTRHDLKATMSGAQFDDLLESAGATPGAPRTKGGAGGYYAASIPKAGEHPVRPTGKPHLERRLSQADFRKKLPPAPAETEKRRFFRTWVRAVPKAKADDLRSRL